MQVRTLRAVLNTNARAKRQHSYPCNPLNPCSIRVKPLLASPGPTSSRRQPRSRPATEPSGATAKRARATDLPARFRCETLAGFDPRICRHLCPTWRPAVWRREMLGSSPSMMQSRVLRVSPVKRAGFSVCPESYRPTPACWVEPGNDSTDRAHLRASAFIAFLSALKFLAWANRRRLVFERILTQIRKG
jgi:hypothetical protein